MNDEKYFFQMKFESTQIAKEKDFPFQEYTEYIVKIFNRDTSWKITKRYRDFFKIHLKNKINFKNLPKFPRKKLFPMRDSVINERTVLIENYLNFIYSEIKTSILNKKYEYLYKFIGLDKVESLLNDSNTVASSSNYETSFYSKSRRSSRISSFKGEAIQLNRRSTCPLRKTKNSNEVEFSLSLDSEGHSNPFQIVKSFKEDIDNFLIKINIDTEKLSDYAQQFYFSLTKSLKNLSDDEIFKLYFGKKESNKYELKGIIHFAGKFDEYSMGSIFCLFILHTSLQFEFNTDCERFINILKKGNCQQIKELNPKRFFLLNNDDYQYKCFHVIFIWNTQFESHENIEEIFDHDLELYELYQYFNKTE